MKDNTLRKHNIYVEIIRPDPSDSDQNWTAVVGVQLLSIPSEHLQNHQNPDQLSPGLAEQVDLINTLFALTPPTTYILRYITQPNRESFSAGKVTICLFGKTIAPNKEDAKKQAIDLIYQIVMQLGGTLPNYRWGVITDRKVFMEFWKPFDWDTSQVVDIRRRDELVELDQVRLAQSIGFVPSPKTSSKSAGEPVYYVHSFVPRPGRFERLLRIMLLHSSPLALTTILAPTSLTHSEEQFLLDSIKSCEGYRSPSSKNLARIQEQRAQILSQGIMDQMLRLQDAPYLLSISLASPESIPTTICEAAGVAVSAPVGEGLNPISVAPLYLQKGGYDVATPSTDEDWRIARRNQAHLSQEYWGRGICPDCALRLRFLMDAYEASSAFRFPHETGEGLAGLEVHSRRLRPLPKEVAQIALRKDRRTLLLGENDYLGLSQAVYLSEKDRSAHMYVVGQTGTGKTTLLKNMILSDMQTGKGLCVIDPHGDLFDEILEIVPDERKDDVVIFDPSDNEFPVGFNLLECTDDQQRQIVVREMRAIMRRYLDDAYKQRAVDYTGPVFYQHMQMNMLLAMSNPDLPGTLLEFYQIYQSRNYWRRWMPLKWQDDQLRRWVDVVLPLNDYTNRRNPQEASMGDYLSSKFIDFVFDPRLRYIFGQPRSTINIGDIMNSEKILLVNLAKGLIGEANATFLGLILMAKFQAEVMSRAQLEPEDRKPFYLYVDEFQSLATENFTVLLSEARKFGVSLILANQFISQIRDPGIMQSIFGNVGILLSFRLGLEDALTIEPQFSPYFDRNDLTNLPNWQACVKAKIGGQAPPAFIMNTLLPNTLPSTETSKAVRKLSREKYGRIRSNVEKIINEALIEPPEAVVEEEVSPFNSLSRTSLSKKTKKRVQRTMIKYHRKVFIRKLKKKVSSNLLSFTNFIDD